MSNDESGKQVNNMADSTNQVQNKPGDSASSEDYIKIPRAGDLDARIKNTDWPVRFQCVVPFPSFNYKAENSFLEQLQLYIGQRMLSRSPDEDEQSSSEYIDGFDHSNDGNCFEMTPTNRVYQKPPLELLKTSSYMYYQQVVVYLRIHADGRTILYAKYKTGMNGDLREACHDGIILSQASEVDKISSYLKKLVTCLFGDFELAVEYDWIITVINAHHMPSVELSPGAKDGDLVEFITESGQLGSFAETEWPVIASSLPVGKGGIRSKHEKHGPLYFEHLDVRKHADGRFLVHAYQRFSPNTIKELGDDDHIFDVFLMSRGSVVPKQEDLYSSISDLAKRMGYSPETVSSCVRLLPGEDLI